jgi:2-haloacid dehalogenase
MSKPTLKFESFEWLTFDCYGTLIDWEAGIVASLMPILASHGIKLGASRMLELYGQLEADLEAETREYMSYRDVLTKVVKGFGERLGFAPTVVETQSLAESLPSWSPFPDTVPALEKLKEKFKLGIVSNTDDDLFAATAKHLRVPFDATVTAQQARSYKPSLHNFRLAVERIGVPKERILHVAQSVYHDVIPARALGLHSVWVNRRGGKPGDGATKTAVGQPDLEVKDLKTLAALAC